MRILIVHRIRLVCDLMAAALGTEKTVQLVQITRSVEEALEKLAADSYDVVLVNINLPDQGALCLTRELVRKKATTKVIVTGLVQSKAAVLRCVEEGAAGYILEEDSLPELMQKIQQVYANQFTVSPNMASVMIARVAELKRKVTEIRKLTAVDAIGPREQLTQREWEVLRQIARWASNQQIADNLVIELGTVKNHVHNILRKLDVQNRKHAVLFARQLLTETSMTQHGKLLVYGGQLNAYQSVHTPTLS